MCCGHYEKAVDKVVKHDDIIPTSTFGIINTSNSSTTGTSTLIFAVANISTTNTNSNNKSYFYYL